MVDTYAVVDSRILVVDDDAQIRRLLSAVVGSAGFACDEAGSADEARVRIAEVQPVLVLLAVQMPGESGLSLARELAARHPQLVVIMISRADDTEVAKIALDTGAYGYLTKPFKRNEIAIAINNALERRRAEIDARTYRTALEDRVLERTAVADDALSRLSVVHEEIVLRLSKAIEFHDPRTGSQIERMGHYCALLAAPFGLDPDTMRVASRLHDLGTIAVPDSILRKPGPLTSDEREQMQRHAEVGYELLKGSQSELLDVAAVIAWTHHERFDGAGYPRGLRGEEIPLAGRVAGVADVFDALNTDRAFRPRVPFEAAVEMLQADRGHFDPNVMDAFLSRMDEVESIAGRFPDPVAPPRPAGAEERVTLMTMKDAAAALAVSASTMRRLADEGRLAAVWTAGGHRRFPEEAVRRLAAEHGARPTVSPIGPPDERIPSLPARLEAEGATLAAAAAAALYRGTKPGWFAGDEAAAEIRILLTALSSGAASARYGGVLEACEELMQRARPHTATLLESHSFLERLRDAILRSLGQAGAAQEELAAARHLFAALQQQLLDRHS